MTPLEQAQADLATKQAALASAQAAYDAAKALVDSLQKNGAAISGFVRKFDGSPFAGITVYNDANNDHTQQGAEAMTSTADDGSYTFNGLAPGPYKIRAILPAGYTQTTPPTPAGVDPKTAYYGLTLTLTSGQKITNANFVFKPDSAPAPTPTPTPTPTGKRWRKGFCCSTSTSAKVLIDNALKLGCDWARTWISANDWNPKNISLPDISAFKGKLAFRPVVTSKTKKTHAEYLAYFKVLLPKMAAMGYEAVSIGNELHFSNYGSWTVDQTMVLQQAAHDAKVQTGAKIILVSCSSFDMNFTENLLKKGLAGLVDEIAIHYYPTNAKGKIAGIKQFVAIIRKYTNKPITEDEHNIHGTDVASWTAQNAISDAALAVGYLDSVAYFYATPIDQPAGAVYLFKEDGTPHEPCWSEWKAA